MVHDASEATNPKGRMARTDSGWRDVLKISGALDKMSQRRKAPLYTISKTTRYPPVRFSRKPGDEVDQWASSLRIGVSNRMDRVSSAPSLLGPGSYPMDCDFPDQFELPAGLVTRTSRVPSYGFDQEQRTDSMGTLKGMSISILHDLAAGSYNRVDVRRFKPTEDPHYSIPKDATGRGRMELMSRTGEEINSC